MFCYTKWLEELYLHALVFMCRYRESERGDGAGWWGAEVQCSDNGDSILVVTRLCDKTYEKYVLM